MFTELNTEIEYVYRTADILIDRLSTRDVVELKSSVCFCQIKFNNIQKQHITSEDSHWLQPHWLHKYGFLIILLTRFYLHPQHVPRDVFLHVSFSLQQWPTFSQIVIKVSSHFSYLNSSSSVLQTESGEFGIDIHVQTELCCASKRILSDHAKNK